MSYKTIKLEISDAIATLTFNRPKVLNALSLEVIGEFHKAISEIEAREEVKVLQHLYISSGHKGSAGPCQYENLDLFFCLDL